MTTTATTSSGNRAPKALNTYGHKTAATGNARNTWFGMPVWDSEEEMRRHGDGGAYWREVKEKGALQRKIMYRAGSANAQMDVKNRLVATLRKRIEENKPATQQEEQIIVRAVAKHRAAEIAEKKRQSKLAAKLAKLDPRTPSPSPNGAGGVPGGLSAAPAQNARNAKNSPAQTFKNSGPPTASNVPKTKPPKTPKPSKWSNDRSTYTYRRTAVPGAVVQRYRAAFPNLNTNDKAANMYLQKTAPPARGESGWRRAAGVAERKVYYHWDAGKKTHIRLTQTEVNNAQQNVGKAVLARKQGWSANGNKFRVANGNALVGVAAKNVAAVKARFRNNINTMNNKGAAAKYLALKRNVPPKEKSGWGLNLNSAGFPRVYYHWDAGKKRHIRLTQAEVDAAQQNVGKAVLARKQGWSADGSKYRVANGNALVGVAAKNVAAVKARFRTTNAPNMNNKGAAAKYLALKRNVPPREKSGWGADLDNAAFPRVYYHWDAGKKRHEKLTEAEVEAANGNKALAARRRKTGWNAERTEYAALDTDDKLVRIAAGTMALVKTKFRTSNAPNMNDKGAAATYLALKRSVPPKEKSDWGYNLTNAALPRVFYHWNAGKKRHEKLTEAEVKAAGDDTGLAARRKKVGWNAARTEYAALIKDGTKLVRIGADTMATIKARLAALRPLNANRSDEHAATAYVNSLARKGNANVGRYNFTTNAYIASGGAVVPGNSFVRQYLVEKAKNNARAAREATPNANNGNAAKTAGKNFYGGADPANARLNLSRANNVATVHGQNTIKTTAALMEEARRAVDAQALAKLPGGGVKSDGFPAWLAGLYDIGGPLDRRPLLTGNVGTPKSGVSPADELRAQEGDGCARLGTRWDGMQGASLMVHQSVVYTMANLRAQGKIQTPGLLALHSVGAGKTVAGLSAMLAFWNTDWAILPVSVRSNQEGNGLDKLAEEAVRYFPWFRDTTQEDYPFARGKQKAREALVARLRLGHTYLGAKTAVDETHLLASVTTIMGDLCWGTKGKPAYLKGGKTLEKCVFIVDEIQMLLSPPPTEIQYAEKNFKPFVAMLQGRQTKTTWVLGMTATPGETADQVQAILRIIAGGGKNKKTVFDTEESIKTNARGLVSFAYVAGDMTRHAKVDVVHECLPLSAFDTAKDMFYTTLYFNRLLRLQETSAAVVRYRSVSSSVPAPLKLPSKAYNTYTAEQKSKFFARVRQKTEFIQMTQAGLFIFDNDNNNTANNGQENKNGARLNNVDIAAELEAAARDPTRPVVKTRSIVAQAPVRAANASRTRGANRAANARANNANNVPKVPRENFFILSPKLVGVIQSILENPKGVHYVYSMEARSLRLIAHVLDTLGFSLYPETYTTRPAPRYCFIDSLPQSTLDMYNPATKGFTRQREVKRSHIKVLLGDIRERRDGVLMSDLNVDGDICRVVLATRASYKGVDIRHVRHVHAVSTLPDYIDILQLVGRGPRNCGHRAIKSVPMRRVTFHHWKLVPGPKDGGGLKCPSVMDERVLFPDCLLAERAIKAYDTGYARLEKALAAVAVDRVLFAEFGKAAEALHTALRTPCAKDTIPSLVPRAPKPKKVPAQRRKATAPARSILEKRLVVWKRRLAKAITKTEKNNAQKIVNDLTERLQSRRTPNR